MGRLRPDLCKSDHQAKRAKNIKVKPCPFNNQAKNLSSRSAKIGPDTSDFGRAGPDILDLGQLGLISSPKKAPTRGKLL